MFDKNKVLTYEGKLENALKVDYGIAYYENGNKKVEGEWVDDQMNGICIEYYESGAILYKGMKRNTIYGFDEEEIKQGLKYEEQEELDVEENEVDIKNTPIKRPLRRSVF